MVTHIARLGKIIGQYSKKDLAKALSDGIIKSTDHWWRQDMKEWKVAGEDDPLMDYH